MKFDKEKVQEDLFGNMSTLNNLFKLEDIVKEVLENHVESRSDDFVLICRVYQKTNENCVIRELFIHTMLNHKEYNLPSFESITRCRRKVFEKHPELKPYSTTKKRKELEEDYKEYSRT